MKHVPYYGNPDDSACALACTLMAAQYLLPKKNFSFEQFSRIAERKEGFVVWGFQLWQWLMDQGIHTTDYDTIDYEGWAKKGVKGLQASVPNKDFKYYKEHSYDLEEESKKIKLMLNHPNFHYIHRTPKWADVITEHNRPGVCDLTLNSRLLNGRDGFSIHRVVLLDITDKEVVFHDPDSDWSGKKRREPLNFFRKVFEAMEEPELARYYIA